MMNQCECINMKHKRRCEKEAKKECFDCGAKLCVHCAKEHHVHTRCFITIGGKHAEPLPF